MCLSVPNRRGMTLVEMLAALALATLLLGAVLSIALGVKRAERQLGAAARGGLDLEETLVRLVREDLTLARTYDFTTNRISLEGYGWLDVDTGEVTQAPALVTYGLVEIGNDKAILRSQESASGTILSVLGTNILSFEVQPRWLDAEAGDDSPPAAVKLTLVRQGPEDTVPTVISRWMTLQ